MAQGRLGQNGSVGRETSSGRTLAALALALLGAACSGGGSSNPAVTSQVLTYTGPTSWTITGPQGGPFVNTSMNFLLENNGSDAVDWSATSIPVFVQLDMTSGTIAGNSQSSVHATLDSAVAQALAAGSSAGTLTFHNNAGNQADVDIACTLSVSAPGVTIQLAPTADFTTTGPAGGPFAPASTLYTVTNTGTATLNWQAIAADPWVTAAPGSGQLAPNASVDVTVAIADAATASLSPGLYWSSVQIVDSSNGSTLDTRNVLLNVSSGAQADGWTSFTPSADTRMVFVSNSVGNDSNDGLSQATPKRTIAAGKALMRDGFPDWLLLKCGDTWDEPIGSWPNSGRSLAEPTLISSYGVGARPFLRTGTADGIVTAYLSNPNYVSVVGLHFAAHLYNGTNGTPKGVYWLRHTIGFLLEDCYVEHYPQNVVIQGFNETNGDLPPNRHSNVRVRRNIISEAYNCINSGGSSTISANGLYVCNCDGILIEENLFDHNGTVDTIPGAIPLWFRHNGYVQNGNTGAILRGNIVYGTDAVMMRSGGVVEDNLYLRNYNAILFGLGTGPEPAGVTGTIHNNVVLDSRDYGDGTGGTIPGGLCIDMGNVAQALVDNNILAHNSLGSSSRPIQMHDDHSYNSYRVVENTTFSNNIVYDWGGVSVDINTGVGGLNQQPVNLHFDSNILENARDTSPVVRHTVSASLAGVTSASNVFDSIASTNSWFQVAGAGEALAQWKASLSPADTNSSSGPYSFPDPNRTITTYMTSLGATPTLAAFIAQCRLQSKADWNTQYTAGAVNTYIRAGFGR